MASGFLAGAKNLPPSIQPIPQLNGKGAQPILIK
jgi:hypothetical protein